MCGRLESLGAVPAAVSCTAASSGMHPVPHALWGSLGQFGVSGDEAHPPNL